MKQLILFLYLFLRLSISNAQENYDTNLISSAMRNRANATIRNEETVIDMRSPENVLHSVKQVITVLNKNGEDNARLVLFYDKNSVIKSIKGEVYNEFGKLINKFSQSDFKDESAVQGFSLFEDSRVKHFLPAVNTYPFTVVYNYEIRYKQNLNIPDWTPKPANDVSVENSKYTFISKPDDEVRIKTQNVSNGVNEQADEKQKVLSWEVKDLPAVKPEPFSPLKDTYQTFVKIAPQQFSYFNYKGEYANWQELGKWYYDVLLKNRSTLPPATVELVKTLIKNEKTDKDKARKIYQYLQDKTRYISIQVGIGGYQPYTAAEVDRLGYGDCKALVNYMQGLLNVARIESYYCVVNGGAEKKSLDPTYASMNQANHIILCMPLDGDTTWLECTNQKIPFGFLGDFTDDRYVLACTEKGGKLLKTPKYATETNLQNRRAELKIAPNGDLSGSVVTVFSGIQYDNHEELAEKPYSEQQKMLKVNYNIDNINFDKISFAVNKSQKPNITEEFNLNVKSYCPINTDKIFIVLNAFNVMNTVPEVKNRTLPFYVPRGFTDIDSVVYTLPENVIKLAQPLEKNITSDFGAYTSSAVIHGNKVIYYRKLVLKEGTFAANEYDKFFNFISQVNTADNLKLVLNLAK